MCTTIFKKTALESQTAALQSRRAEILGLRQVERSLFLKLSFTKQVALTGIKISHLAMPSSKILVYDHPRYQAMRHKKQTGIPLNENPQNILGPTHYF